MCEGINVLVWRDKSILGKMVRDNRVSLPFYSQWNYHETLEDRCRHFAEPFVLRRNALVAYQKLFFASVLGQLSQGVHIGASVACLAVFQLFLLVPEVLPKISRPLLVVGGSNVCSRRCGGYGPCLSLYFIIQCVYSPIGWSLCILLKAAFPYNI